MEHHGRIRAILFCLQLVKLDHKKKAGVLHPILVPELKLQQITIKLVTNFPEFKENAIANSWIVY